MSRRTSNTNLLSPQIRQTLNNLSQRIFYHEPKNYSELQNEDPGSEVSTSLVLQMTLFFNLCFYPFWITSNALMLSIKYNYLDFTFRVIVIAVLVIFSFIEIIRLYLGYVGNLEEKAAELFGFLLLTLLPQFELLLFLLLTESVIVMPLERAVDIILTLMFIVEFFWGVNTALNMSRQQATKFHLRQFIDLEQIQDNREFIDRGAPKPAKRHTYRA